MAKNPGKGPKSHHADGTPKKRWTAAERADRGHKPRRSGGTRSNDREGRDTAGRPGRDGVERQPRAGIDRAVREGGDRFDRSPRRYGAGDDGRGRFDGRRGFGSRADDRAPARTPQGEKRWGRDGVRDGEAYRGDRFSRGWRDDVNRRDGDGERARGDRFSEDRFSDRRRGGEFSRDRSRDDRYRDDRRNYGQRNASKEARSYAGRGTVKGEWKFDARQGNRDDRFEGRRSRQEPQREWRDRADRRPYGSREDDRRPNGRYENGRRADERGDGNRREYGRVNRREAADWREGPREVSRDDSRGHGDRRWQGRDERWQGRDDRHHERSQHRRPFRESHRLDDRDHHHRGFRDFDNRRGFRDAADSGFLEPDPTELMDWAEPEAISIDDAASAQGGFVTLGVHPSLVKALASQGITEPFPIQQATITDAIAGRDVLGRGRTGSGKTLAFGLSLLTRLANHPGDRAAGRAPQAMILVPTRELALQVADVLGPLAKTVGLFLTLVTGGMSYTPQQRAFARGVDIVVATPGRLIDLLEQESVDLTQVQVSVLDEADEMADMGFMPDVSTLLDATPTDGQRLLFSATLDKAVDAVVHTYLHNPAVHEVDSATQLVTTMTHRMLHVLPQQKMPVAAQIAGRQGRTLAFVRTQMGAERTARDLREAGIVAGALHGGMTQGARRRTLDAFRAGDISVLIATDVAARGIDIDDVSLVLQIDPPREAKDYTHRAGRTARAGESGTVVTLVLPHQRRQVARLAQQAGVPNTIVRVAAGDDYLNSHVGEATDREPISEDTYRELVAPKQPVRTAKKKPSRKFNRRVGGGHGYGHRGGAHGHTTRVERHDH